MHIIYTNRYNLTFNLLQKIIKIFPVENIYDAWFELSLKTKKIENNIN